jgi:pyrimidine deaminase RibD-like protein
MIIQEILTVPSNDPREELDRILAKCCELVLNGQEQDADFYGMVGACVVCPDGRLIYGVNYQAKDGTRVHAERAALERCTTVDPKCIIVTTLSPCNRPMDERSGESCEDLIAAHGIEHVYCGYKDPTQDSDDSIETKNPKLQKLCKQLADTFLDEDYDPNGPPPGPEFKPTMPAGTVKVDVSDVYDWYKLGQHISNLDGLGKHDFGSGPPSTIMAFGSEEQEHKYIDALKKTGLTTTDIDPVDPKQPKGMRRQKTDPTYNVAEARKKKRKSRGGYYVGYPWWGTSDNTSGGDGGGMAENFHDGKVKGKSRPGRVKRAGASCKGSVTSLRSKAKNASGERAKMYHWCANMKAGRNK